MTESRVPLIDPSGRTDLADSFAQVAAPRGGVVPNVFRAMAHSPESMQAVAALGAHVRFGTLLDDFERELAILTVARALGCTYEWTHHLRGLLATGLTDEQVVAHLESPPTPRAAAILKVVRDLAEGRTPRSENVAELRARTDDRIVVETLILAGYYVLLGRTILALSVPLETGVEALPLPHERTESP